MMIRTVLSGAAFLMLNVPALAGADAASTAVALEPTVDRWNYGNNAQPGFRAKGSLFTGLPGDEDGGADRLGQIVLGFDTAAMGVSIGASPGSYQLGRVTVTAMVANDADWLMDPPLIYDPSADPFDSVLEGGTDADPGHPVELHGTGFRNGFSSRTYVEGAPPPALGQPPIPGTPYSGSEGTTVYPLGFNEGGVPRDVTNSPSLGFESRPWATGYTEEVLAGEEIPVDTVLSFEVDLEQPGVRRYVQEGLAQGMLFFTLSSLQPAVFDGGSGGQFAIFYMKESVEHDLFGDSAATLEIEYELVEESSIAMDVRYDISSNEIRLIWDGEAGAVYELISSVDLDAWASLAEVAATDDGALEYRPARTAAERCFYQVRRKSP